MKIGIVGSRSFTDYELFLDKVEMVLMEYGLIGEIGQFIIVSGGADGADTLAAHFAKTNGLDLEVYLPDWNRNPRSAGILRNYTIINASDVIIAFWDGKSPGTAHTIEASKKLGKPIHVIDTVLRDFRKEAQIATIEHLYED